MSHKPLSIRALFERPGPPAYPFYDDLGQLCWLEALTKEGGRLAIKQQASAGERIVTPRGFQVRSRVHEYGGKCFCVAGSVLYFNNFIDGQIYRQHLHQDEMPHAISLPVKAGAAYADLHYSKVLNALVAVQEISGAATAENINRIVAFSLDKSAPSKPTILAEGSEFYAAPCLSDEGDQLAWIEWSNPNMPWDETYLFCADISKSDARLKLGQAVCIAGGEGKSVCQPGFLSGGDLVFAMDSDALRTRPENYWNLYRYEKGRTEPLTRERAEFGEAHWVFGQRRWLQLNEHSLLAICTRDEVDVLCEIDLRTAQVNECSEAASRFSQLFMTHVAATNETAEKSGAVGIVQFPDRPPAIFSYQADGIVSTCKSPADWMDREQVSESELLCYPTRDGEHAFANYYAAKPIGAEMPISLLVLVHGGPTARADTALSPLVQYFCQNGFAILDVNHRGSTGHGRHYRQKLLGEWGEIDANDIADAIEFAFTQKQHDPERVFIRGGSAGGYAVLRALTRFPELFSGGACYYGIGNLITLAEITHKFEGKYTDRLIGETYDPDRAQCAQSRFRTRSPIFDIDRISSPLILFQGLDDKVVPPQVSREMVETLAENGVKHEYIEYAEEGHGFRMAETKIDALQKEINFYRMILADD